MGEKNGGRISGQEKADFRSSEERRCIVGIDGKKITLDARRKS